MPLSCPANGSPRGAVKQHDAARSAGLAQKAAVGINAALLGILLSVVGFEANVDQSGNTLLGMKAIMALIPALGAVAILLILRGYTLDKTAHQALVDRIRETAR